MAEHICDICIHEQACAAWVRHCTALYEDFKYSTDNCPYFAPMAKGEWVDKWGGRYANQCYKCSVCGGYAFADDKRWYLTDYCPDCGAKMDGGKYG